jgi:hypothetical protein
MDKDDNKDEPITLKEYQSLSGEVASRMLYMISQNDNNMPDSFEEFQTDIEQAFDKIIRSRGFYGRWLLDIEEGRIRVPIEELIKDMLAGLVSAVTESMQAGIKLGLGPKRCLELMATRL